MQDVLGYVVTEIKQSEMQLPGVGGVRPISWSGIRHMVAEVGDTNGHVTLYMYVTTYTDA